MLIKNGHYYIQYLVFTHFNSTFSSLKVFFQVLLNAWKVSFTYLDQVFLLDF
jgi:hypothetical protein